MLIQDLLQAFSKYNMYLVKKKILLQLFLCNLFCTFVKHSLRNGSELSLHREDKSNVL